MKSPISVICCTLVVLVAACAVACHFFTAERAHPQSAGLQIAECEASPMSEVEASSAGSEAEFRLVMKCALNPDMQLRLMDDKDFTSDRVFADLTEAMKSSALTNHAPYPMRGGYWSATSEYIPSGYQVVEPTNP